MNGYAFYNPNSQYGHGHNSNPLYPHGQLGKFAAQQNPQGYYNYALSQAGLGDTLGQDPFHAALQNAYQSVYSAYQNAQGSNDNLGFMKYLHQQFGAPGHGTPMTLGQHQLNQHPNQQPGDWSQFGQHMRDWYAGLSPTARGDVSPAFTFNRGSWSWFG